ncbi:MAG: hypothetical protein FRX49_10139 [Trebouxia sp. A1-2]|nr:MAG: hypothetical protein FRX49_10139 [Trebouxia sp. A1-2]
MAYLLAPRHCLMGQGPTHCFEGLLETLGDPPLWGAVFPLPTTPFAEGDETAGTAFPAPPGASLGWGMVPRLGARGQGVDITRGQVHRQEELVKDRHVEAHLKRIVVLRIEFVKLLSLVSQALLQSLNLQALAS